MIVSLAHASCIVVLLAMVTRSGITPANSGAVFYLNLPNVAKLVNKISSLVHCGETAMQLYCPRRT